MSITNRRYAIDKDDLFLLEGEKIVGSLHYEYNPLHLSNIGSLWACEGLEAVEKEYPKWVKWN